LAVVPTLLACAAFVIPATPGSADPSTMVYVDNSRQCSNSGTGSQSLPFCSIQTAADMVVPGQTVQVSSATRRTRKP
jgi:hypothetical protein